MLTDRVIDADPADPPLLASWVGGAFDERPGEETIDVLDPATGRRLARLAEAGTDGVGRAVGAAEAAAPA